MASANTTKVSFKITKQAKLDSIGKHDGQLIFVEPDGTGDSNDGVLYLDFHGRRIRYGIGKCEGAEPVDVSGAIKFIGIVQTLPTSASIVIDGEARTAEENNMVVFETKEYIYRKGANGQLGWFEVGDEDAGPTWEDDTNS